MSRLVSETSPRDVDPPASDESVAGNERLTASAGAVLFVLLAAEGFTLLGVRQMLTLHEFIGVLIVGPIVLKIGTTGWRFVRYYAGVPSYRRKGPPWLPLRLLAPVLVLSTITLVGSGIALWAYGRDTNGLLLLHKASFVVWIAVCAIHVLFYMWRVPALMLADLRPSTAVPRGRLLRLGLLALSVVAGVALAVGTIGGHASFRHHDDGGFERVDR